MMALGLKKVLGYVGGDDGHTLADPLYGVPLVRALRRGRAVPARHVAFRLRDLHTLNRPRLAVAVCCSR